MNIENKLGPDPTRPGELKHSETKGESPDSICYLPDGPWVASRQYGRYHFILGKNNETVWKCSHIPFGMVQKMVAAANEYLEENESEQERDV